MTTTPVWVWLPGTTQPVRAGEFEISGAVGRFSYTAEFRERPGAFALDPVSLPFTRSQRPHTETKHGGLFGVFRDASPEGFGLELLKRRAGSDLTSPLERLELSAGDAVGAIEVCRDIERKLAWRPVPLELLIERVQALGPTQSASRAVREEEDIEGTSLGGERPKMTVLHEGQFWIAKLAARGDARHAVVREYAAMQSASAAGVDVAQTHFIEAGHRQLLIVERFDRQVTGEGVQRIPYASAHTMLRLDQGTTRGDPRRSYVGLAIELRRWHSRAEDAKSQLRELFLRMVVNAVVGNGDDHPRNHGVIRKDGVWSLSPAFDIAPHITFSETLSMATNRTGRCAATASELVADCETFGFSRAEALDCMEAVVEAVQQAWPAAVQRAGLPAAEVPAPDPQRLQIKAARDAGGRPRRRVSEHG